MENFVFCAALINIFWFIAEIAATIILLNILVPITVGSALQLPQCIN